MTEHVRVVRHVAGVSPGDLPENTSRFARNVTAMLERTEYRRSDRGEDLEDVYRLRYKAYRSNDMIPDDENHAIHDELDDTPNSFRFGVYIDQHLVSTLRIHHLTPAMPWSPSMKAFGDIVEPMLAQGRTFICPSRFASDPDWSKVYPQIPYLTLRLPSMACLYFQAAYGLSTVREDHAGFYRRIYYAEQIGEARSYPGVYNKVVLYRADVTDMPKLFQRFPFFKSTAMERRMMFGRPASGELAPLTILPTAKYYRDAA